MKGNHYPFIPLKGNEEWSKTNYGVRGTPANFLIDAEGKIVYRPDARNKEQQKTLEQQIEGLLEQRGKK